LTAAIGAEPPFRKQGAWPGLVFHFEEGGIVPTHGRVDGQDNEQDFLLPSDVDPLLVALAIDEKLRDGQKAPPGIGDDPMRLLERKSGWSHRCRRSSPPSPW
jgi:hypothetical protein